MVRVSATSLVGPAGMLLAPEAALAAHEGLARVAQVVVENLVFHPSHRSSLVSATTVKPRPWSSCRSMRWKTKETFDIGDPTLIGRRMNGLPTGETSLLHVGLQIIDEQHGR